MIRNERPWNTTARAFLPRLPYRDAVLYGPIQSRRIGYSLGINLCSVTTKVCSYNCVYCQFPKLRIGQDWRTESGKLLRTPELLQIIRKGINERIQRGLKFDSITLSGNGDPSVHPDLLVVARFLHKLIRKLDLNVVLSIFTNAVPYDNPEFIEALSLFDRVIVKLDAADETTFYKINRPQSEVRLENLTNAISHLNGTIIQPMVITGLIDNRGSILSQRYLELVERAQATEIQIYTINKYPAVDGVLPVSEEELNTLAEDLRRKSKRVPVVVYYQDWPSGFPDESCPAKKCFQVPAYE